MTPAVIDLTAYNAVLFDFDGPMCNVFAGYPAATVADELKQILTAHGWPATALPATSDPHQILRIAHQKTPSLAPAIEAALTAGELTAMDTGTETPGLPTLLAQLEASRTQVAVASNNNAGAIRQWLYQHGYEITHVVGRDPKNPERMKPAPCVLVDALALLQVPRSNAVFIGDAATDAEAAAAAQCDFIAFANKPHKVQQFGGLGCTTIITELRQLVSGSNASHLANGPPNRAT